MNELAIEAILRDDLALLASLFRLFNPNSSCTLQQLSRWRASRPRARRGPVLDAHPVRRLPLANVCRPFLGFQSRSRAIVVLVFAMLA